MKSVKVIFIAVEIAALYAVVFLAFAETTNVENWMKAAFISLFAVLAVVMQKEQQSINWDSDEEEAL